MRIHCLALILLLGAAPAAAQIKGPVAPAITPEQTALSESLAPKFDESAAREKARLETFANRPLGGVIQRSFNVFSNYLVMAAEMMPESGYTFRPTPDLRTFGEQINHATGAHYSFCNQAGLHPECKSRRLRISRPSREKPAITRRSESIDRLLRSRPRCGDRESWLMETRAGPRRFIQRPDQRHPRDTSSTARSTARKTTERSPCICACRASFRHRPRCIRHESSSVQRVGPVAPLSCWKISSCCSASAVCPVRRYAWASR